MCPVLCDPPRHVEDLEPTPRRRRTRHAMGLLLCVLLAATPLLYHSPPVAISEFLAPVWTSRPVAVARSVARPAARLAAGDVRPVKSWVNHQTTSRLLILASLGVCLGVYLMLRD